MKILWFLRLHVFPGHILNFSLMPIFQMPYQQINQNKCKLEYLKKSQTTKNPIGNHFSLTVTVKGSILM